MKRLLLSAAVVGALASAVGAAAPQPKPAKPVSPKTAPAKPEPLPAGTVDSGVISFDMVTHLQNLAFTIRGPKDKSGQAVIVRTVLPDKWTEEENGRKKGSSELDPNIGVFTMLAKPPTTDNSTDFVYELRIYPNNLTEGPFEVKDDRGRTVKVPEKDRTQHGMFTLYLNSMISELIKQGFRCESSPSQIQSVQYGIIPDENGKPMLMGTRPEPMYFVPLAFTNKENGSTIYSFSGVVGDKVVSLRFLVAKDQAENYKATIAYIVNNTWGLTLDQDSQWTAEMQKKISSAEDKEKAAEQKQPAKGGKTH
jgi:hypothetical protein